MASLGALPVELLRIIGDYVYADAATNYAAPQSRHGAVNDLVSLTMTSRHFHGVFNPLLYHWDRGHGLYAMSWAINRHKPRTLQKILAVGVDVDREVHDYSSGMTARPISMALESRSLDCLKLLLEYGANPDGAHVSDHPYRISDSSSALYFSQSQHREDEEVALILLKHGARKYFRMPYTLKPIVSTTALHQAAACGHVKVVQHLLAEGDIEVDMPDKFGRTPFYHAAIRHEDTTAILQMLLEHGANRSSDTCILERALRDGHVENVILLLCKQTDFCHQTLYNYLYDLNYRLLERTKTFPGDSLDEDVPRIISKLIDLGADFNNPPPPFFDEHGK
ncbi:hypothetical protein PFICI_04930 [Pestalotiopsis fici W106-1]|uniref:Uncharacterized protein n=1 Tax=Pestalotiopsis fici (strain W106-1 / CGMCC3.15140) TaxID=1229662 RepID=W3XAJ2_PESFW|nr:uncharacterized protein PFICI_04930 [Pestalotiopsis fici W106-1]ETS83054.1 hypothetical protein PFICI_04930 [Pestalotiopsis fici W106-1]